MPSIFGHGDAAVDVRNIALVENIRKVGVEACGHIGGQALGVCLYRAGIAAQSSSDFTDQIQHQFALHTGCTLTADFFLVCKDDHRGMRTVIAFKQCSQGRVCADLVIVTVSANQ